MIVPKLLGIPENEPACPDERVRETGGDCGDKPKPPETKQKDAHDPQTCLDHIRENLADGIGGIEGLPDIVLGNMDAFNNSTLALIFMIYVTYQLYKTDEGRAMMRAMLAAIIRQKYQKVVTGKTERIGKVGDSVRRCNL
ncbi:hypothetical protein [Salaquimonas pukyongi]|uniref:hypothetical protein n=1 Tax=Salaquimonas pukyongi TaxID=2712698 RepID=UPI00096B8C98|nr:hypothetical protein [Salaquimonas pukyongi]